MMVFSRLFLVGNFSVSVDWILMAAVLLISPWAPGDDMYEYHHISTGGFWIWVRMENHPGDDFDFTL